MSIRIFAGPRTLAPRAPEPSLTTLMEHYVSGRDEVFATLYRRVAPRVRRQIRTRAMSPTDADDLLQLTFLRAHAARGKYRVRPEAGDESVIAWFCAIARNATKNHMRSVYRDRLQFGPSAEITIAGSEDTPADPTDIAIAETRLKERRDAVHSALERLPPSQREVVRLSKLEGLPMSAIAERFGVRDGAIRVRAHRAYKSLRRWLTVPGMLEFSNLHAPV